MRKERERERRRQRRENSLVHCEVVVYCEVRIWETPYDYEECSFHKKGVDLMGMGKYFTSRN